MTWESRVGIINCEAFVRKEVCSNAHTATGIGNVTSRPPIIERIIAVPLVTIIESATVIIEELQGRSGDGRFCVIFSIMLPQISPELTSSICGPSQPNGILTKRPRIRKREIFLNEPQQQQHIFACCWFELNHDIFEKQLDRLPHI